MICGNFFLSGHEGYTVRSRKVSEDGLDGAEEEDGNSASMLLTSVLR
jgi:hypothetical protein